jgi:hypothetical protein
VYDHHALRTLQIKLRRRVHLAFALPSVSSLGLRRADSCRNPLLS